MAKTRSKRTRSLQDAAIIHGAGGSTRGRPPSALQDYRVESCGRNGTLKRVLCARTRVPLWDKGFPSIHVVVKKGKLLFVFEDSRRNYFILNNAGTKLVQRKRFPK